MKTIAAPISTSYANTYKVAASYPGAYGAYGAGYHAPIAAAYHAPGYGAYSGYGAALHAPLAAPIVKAAYPGYGYGAGYATYHH